jgi:tetratricopeptide (TPR) repeat protein/nucleoside phosphorylase
MSRKRQVDIGIITIREDENEAVLKRLPEQVEAVSYRNRRYRIRRLQLDSSQTYTIAVVRCIEQGNGEAQAAARDLLEDLNPAWLFIVGIAGGVPANEFTLGDVIVSTRIADFSVEAVLKDHSHEYALTGGRLHPGASQLAADIRGMVLDGDLGGWNSDTAITMTRPPVVIADELFYGEDDWKREVRGKIERHFQGQSARPPLVTAGTIASSDRLIKEAEILQVWLKIARQIQAVEMESAGVYRAVHGRDVPFLAIRGISDVVGYKRHADWTAYACHTAAAFLLAFLRTGAIPPRTIKPRPKPPQRSDDSPSSPTNSVRPAPNVERGRSLQNAPLPPVHFVGREAELTKLAYQLRSSDTVQAITAIQGMGGIGKTTLAQMIAHQMADVFAGGVLWADLPGSKGDPLPILGTWAYLCGGDVSQITDPLLRAQQVRSLLAEHIRTHGRVLLVLDDVRDTPIEGKRETWVDGVRILLAARTTDMAVLMTTRDYELAISLGACIHMLETLDSDDALRLIIQFGKLNERIIQQEHDLALELVTLLDGLPLALEIAGQIIALEARRPDWQFRDLVADINKRANAVLRIRGNRASLYATFDISYALLDQQMQRLFRSLGVFEPPRFNSQMVANILNWRSSREDAPELVPPEPRGAARFFKWFQRSEQPISTTPADPEQEGLDPAVVRVILNDLVDRSLVRTGEVRNAVGNQYTLHPLVHAYARELLDAADESQNIREAYIDTYLDYAEEPIATTAEHYAALDKERLNIFSAMDRAFERQQWQQVCRFMRAIDPPSSPYLSRRGLWSDLQARLEQAITAADLLGNMNEWATFVGNRAIVLRQIGDIAAAKQDYLRVKETFERLENEREVAIAEYYLADIARESGETEEARRYYESVLNRGKEGNYADIVRISTLGLANLLVEQGNIDMVQDIYKDSLEHIQDSYRAANDRILLLINLGLLLIAQNDPLGAADLYAQAYALLDDVTDEFDRADICKELGRFAQQRGDKEAARQLYTQSSEIAERIGLRDSRLETAILIDLLTQDAGRNERIWDRYMEILSINNESGALTDYTFTLGNLAQFAIKIGRYQESYQFYEQQLQFSQRLENKLTNIDALYGLGWLTQLTKSYISAEPIYADALAIARAINNPARVAVLLSQQAICVFDQGEYGRARAMIEQARVARLRSDLYGIVNDTQIMSFLEQVFGNFESQEQLLEESLVLAARAQAPDLIANVQIQRGTRAMSLGRYDEARDWYMQAFTNYREGNDLVGEFLAELAIANLDQVQDKLDHANDAYQRLLRIAEQSGIPRHVGYVRCAQGQLASRQEQFTEAREYLAAALEIFERIGARAHAAEAINALGRIDIQQSDYASAHVRINAALVIARELPYPLLAAQSEFYLGLLDHLRGNYGQAEQLCRKALGVFERFGSLWDLALTHGQIGVLYRDQELFSRSLEHLEQSLMLWKELDNQVGIADAMSNLGVLAQQRGAFSEAHQYYDASLTIYDERNLRRSAASVQCHAGSLAYEEGYYDHAEELLHTSISIAQTYNDQRTLSVNYYMLGKIAHTRGRHDLAAATFQQSLHISDAVEDQRGSALNLLALGELEMSRGNTAAARTFLRRSLVLFQRLDIQPRITAINLHLSPNQPDKRTSGTR